MRHADAGYEIAKACAKEQGLKLPMLRYLNGDSNQMARQKGPEPPPRSFEENAPDALAKTGFVFENEVANAFRAENWGVITSRYYVDDVDGRARELDLVAYKVTKGKDVEVVTTLLVSCKKDSENAWIVLSNAKSATDPNADWAPVNWWTNNEILNAFLASANWRDDYVKADHHLRKDIFLIDRQAFAFQIVSRDGKASRNDRPIFESISELLKALGHEESILPERTTKNRIYVFNLMVAIDAPLYEASYDTSQPKVFGVEQFRHLARYIVNRKSRSARVHLVSKSHLGQCIESYGKLAEFDAKYFNVAVDKAYASYMVNSGVKRLLEAKISMRIRFFVNNSLERLGIETLQQESLVNIDFDKKANELILRLPLVDEKVSALNDDDNLMRRVKHVVTEALRYSGAIRIADEDIPF